VTILITGGAGYIGSRLARCLVTGHEVTVIDNNHRGTAYTPGTRHIAWDIRDAALLDELTATPTLSFTSPPSQPSSQLRMTLAIALKPTSREPLTFFSRREPMV
jgi:UDP-glucose 4-epimerase